MQPISEIGELARKHNILFHTDASQSLGKVKIDVQELKVDMLTIAGHKLYAPKGKRTSHVEENRNWSSLQKEGCRT